MITKLLIFKTVNFLCVFVPFCKSEIRNQKSPTFKALCFFVILFFPIAVFAQENLSVDFGTVIQDNFLGVNAVYHGFSYMPESLEQGMNQELRAIELQRVEESGLRLARTFYRPDWAMGERAWTTADWQSVKMKALYAWLTDMQERNVDVALNMGWWFARDVIWNRDQHLPTYPDDMEKYTEWVSESLHQIIELREFSNVKYIFMFTEPGNKYGDIPNGKNPWQYYKEVLLAVHQRLTDDNRRQLVKIVGPNTTQAPRWIERAAKELNSVIDVYASHNYNFDTYQEWYDLAVKVRRASKETGKPFWIDEYGFQEFTLRQTGAYGNIIAQANAAFLNAGAQTSMIWILNDQYYPYPLKHITNGDAFLDGKHSWGLYPWLPESSLVRPAWKAFTLLSKFLGGEGTKVCVTEGTSDLHVSAVNLPDGNTSILVVNGSIAGKEVKVELSSPLKDNLYKYLYDPAEPDSSLFKGGIAVGVFRNKITDRLPAQAVVVYSTIKSDETVMNNVPVLVVDGSKNTEGNIAYLKSIHSSNAGTQWPLGNLTDGKRLTFWSSKKYAENHPEALIVDLGKTYPVGQIDLYPRSDKEGSTGEGFPVDFSIEVSLDKKKWQEVVSRHSYAKPGSEVQSFNFTKLPGKYIRLNATKLRKSSSGNFFKMQLGEIKAFVD